MFVFPARGLPERDGKSLHVRLGRACLQTFVPVCFTVEGSAYQAAMAKVILGTVIRYSWFATSDILTTL